MKDADKKFYEFIRDNFLTNPKTSWGRNELISRLKDLYIEWLERNQERD